MEDERVCNWTIDLERMVASSTPRAYESSNTVTVAGTNLEIEFEEDGHFRMVYIPRAVLARMLEIASAADAERT
jgi:hypothetical protein